MQQRGLSHSCDYLRLCYLLHSRCTETKKYGPNERTDKTPEKELSNERIDNLSDAEFKTLVIRMLTEMIEFSRKVKEEMKAMQREIKESIQGQQ